MYTASQNSFNKIFPFRITSKPEIENETIEGHIIMDIETIRGNNSNVIYFICRILGTNICIEPMTEEVITQHGYNVHDHFDETKSSDKNSKKRSSEMQYDTLDWAHKIFDEIYSEYEYPARFKNAGFIMDDLFKGAKNNRTPYIAPWWQYSTRYGILPDKIRLQFTNSL